jgi:alpha-galactosidase
MIYIIKTIRSVLILSISVFHISFAFSQKYISSAPPDQPSEIHISGKQIDITYNGRRIFYGNINLDKNEFMINQVLDKKGKSLSQVIKFTSLSGKPLHITGSIIGSKQSFPCSVDRPMVADKDIVRNSVGLSHSLLNRSVYDRKWDWVLSVDYFSNVVIEPNSANSYQNTFQITVSGKEISIRFRPRYYQFHRGLKYYEPWTYEVWKPSVAGWCSWYAYMDNINEENIKKTADVISEKLLPYGYDHLQIDDGYQQPQVGFPNTWLNANNKFPSGLGSLAKYIRSKGLIPGIWNNVSFQDRDSAFAHKELFVLNEKGEPAKGQWIGYSLDGSNPKAINKIIRPVFKGFTAMGWQYFKVDALRHLRYEGYNSNLEYFNKKKIDRVIAYRNVVKAIREEVGKNNFILGCWGIRPELIGLINACRIGDDGYSWEEMAQYNSFNNVVWRNDPDHIQLASKDAYRDCMVASMTGSLIMLTDKPKDYDTGNIEPAIRTVPVLFTRPGQLYDVDPSRSMNLNRVNTEMSGSGSRVFDASRSTPYDLFLEEINEPYENWMMLGRVGEKRKFIRFNELGLDAKKAYLVFEFWSKTLKGTFKEGFAPGTIDTTFNCQLFCIRELQAHPQLLATSRHISCGAQELKNLSWNKNILSGVSNLPADNLYVIYLNEPKNYNFKSFECKGATFIESGKVGSIREIKLQSTSGIVKWKAIY